MTIPYIVYVPGLAEASHNWSVQNSTLRTIQLNLWVVDSFPTAVFLFVSVML